MKLLLSAYCCAPQSASEQGFGWSWATRCAQRHEVTVVTCEAQKDKIEAHLQENPINIRFEYVNGPSRVSYSGTQYRFERLHQVIWQIRAVRKVRSLLKTDEFDLAQHVTIGSWRQPSCFAFCSIPYIFGPTSGSEVIPPGFLLRLGARGALWEKTREIMIVLARWDPLVRRTLKRSARILAAGPATYADMKMRYSDKTVAATRAYQKENISQRWRPRQDDGNSPIPFVISWSGRLIPRKGLDILIHALSDKRLSHCVLDIMGDGPKRAQYVRLATKLGILDRIHFLGHMNQELVFTRICNSDLFVFTSLQDMMGQSLSEAMQLGVPCAVLDWSGPSWLVAEDGAYKVEVGTYEGTCKNLAEAIVAIKGNSDLRHTLGSRARSRIESLTDPKSQAEEIDAIFEGVVRRKS